MTLERATRVSQACAPGACVAFIAFYIIAAFEDPGYAIFENYLSDLGVGPGAWAFNVGAIIAGCLLAAFATGGFRSYFGDNTLMRGGSVLLGISGALLIGVGVFTEDAGDAHLLFSYAFFICAFLSLAVLASGRLVIVRTYSDSFVLISAASFLVGAAVAIASGPDPFAETIAVFTLLVWGFIAPTTAALRNSGSYAE